MEGLITPRPGAGICPVCFNFTRELSGRCRACRASESHLRAVVPIAYAAAGGPLHQALANYKRSADPAVPFLIDQLATTLSRFLAHHEGCVATAAGVDRFEFVATVPSSRAHGEVGHPLHQLVAERVPEVRPRYRRLLGPSGVNCVPHRFDRRRFRVAADVRSADVLLIDDVWTTGANAQSAAAVLREAGARTIAIVVIGRYVNGHWGGIAERLAAMRPDSDAQECAVCTGRRVRPSDPVAG